MAVGKLFSGFLSTCIPGFHKVWYVFIFQQLKKIHKGILYSRSAHCGAYRPLRPILINVIVLLSKSTGELFKYKGFFFFLAQIFSKSTFNGRKNWCIHTCDKPWNLDFQATNDFDSRLSAWETGNIILHFLKILKKFPKVVCS